MSVLFTGRAMASGLLLLLGAWLFFASAPPARAYPGPDAQCPYGWDTRSNTCLQPPAAGNGGGNMDAACQATAQFSHCQASVYIGCNSFGNQYACRLLQLSYANPGGFQQIMNAQKACLLDRNQQACTYLQRFKGTYF